MDSIRSGILERFRAPPHEMVSESGRFINFMGLRTRVDFFAGGDTHDGAIFNQVPDPDDGIYGGVGEYSAILSAVEASKERFTIVELGAGWGPWISAAGVACRRWGIGDVTLVAVEAVENKLGMIQDHLWSNGLGHHTIRVLHGAAWDQPETVQIPSWVAPVDYGAAAGQTGGDYRGHETPMVDVPGLTLDMICEGLGIIDFMHWDVQGAEVRLVQSNLELLDSRVRRLFIGTHSRSIEGRIMDALYGLGWHLAWEQPCRLRYDSCKPTLEGMTIKDGEQYWINPKLV
ncbi:hypothetical protein KOAAANKH_02503 [Brevundimonas sp. NIBR10]|nr:hypothetical protein KOAAANKH_02503 [Brevundimonas sp. NIBR10]